MYFSEILTIQENLCGDPETVCGKSKVKTFNWSFLDDVSKTLPKEMWEFPLRTP